MTTWQTIRDLLTEYDENKGGFRQSRFFASSRSPLMKKADDLVCKKVLSSLITQQESWDLITMLLHSTVIKETTQEQLSFKIANKMINSLLQNNLIDYLTPYLNKDNFNNFMRCTAKEKENLCFIVKKLTTIQLINQENVDALLHYHAIILTDKAKSLIWDKLEFSDIHEEFVISSYQENNDYILNLNGGSSAVEYIIKGLLLEAHQEALPDREINEESTYRSLHHRPEFSG